MNTTNQQQESNIISKDIVSLPSDQQFCSRFSSLVENINKQHKEFKLFKQLIKRQSKNLEQFLNSMIQISRQFGSNLFDGFHFHLTTFQQEIQNQYVLLKQQGKHFYVIKQEAAACQKKLSKIELTFGGESTQSELDQRKISSFVETQYWNQKQDYSILRMKDVQYKAEKLTQQTSIIIEDFIEQHNLRIGSSQRTNRKANQSDSNQSSYKKQCQVPAILTIENFCQFQEREDFTESENTESSIIRKSPYESLYKLES